ncbi:uncharacterized protein METZ01_LOCUS484013, partial [marine metagenome]
MILAHYNSSNKGLSELSNIIDKELVMIKADLSIEDETISMIEGIENKYGIPNKII